MENIVSAPDLMILTLLLIAAMFMIMRTVNRIRSKRMVPGPLYRCGQRRYDTLQMV